MYKDRDQNWIWKVNALCSNILHQMRTLATYSTSIISSYIYFECVVSKTLMIFLINTCMFKCVSAARRHNFIKFDTTHVLLVMSLTDTVYKFFGKCFELIWLLEDDLTHPHNSVMLLRLYSEYLLNITNQSSSDNTCFSASLYCFDHF